MKIDVNNFETVLKKATLNYSLDNVQLNIGKSTIKSKMTTNSNDAIVILNVENNVFPVPDKMKDDYQFNFQDPNSNIMPYLSLIEQGMETDIGIHSEKIILKTGNQKSNIFFCSPQVVSVFTRDGVRPGTEFFTSFNLTEDLSRQFSMIKKIGMRFGKVYFGVSNGMLIMETTDKTNRFSNGIKFELFELEMDDLNLCFDYKNFINVLSAIGEDYQGFAMHIAYIKEADLGMIFIGKNDESEKYYLMSKQDG